MLNLLRSVFARMFMSDWLSIVAWLSVSVVMEGPSAISAPKPLPASSSQALASMLTLGITVCVLIGGAVRVCAVGEEGLDVV
jgi:hypothetical protein